MSLPDPFPPFEESQPEPPPPSLARARRRRARRMLFPADPDAQADVLTDLARRSYPTYELYIFSLLCGAILGAGYLLDSQAVLIFGILAAPLLTPWVGLTIAGVTGSVRFFAQTLAALFISALMVFIIGLVAGFADTPFEPRTLNQIYMHSSLWWPDLVVLALGAILLVVSFVRSETRPSLPSVMLAYEFYLPISAAGFGIGAGLDGVWPQAALVFVVYFAWATFFGLVALAFMRFRPRSLGGVAFSLFLLIAVIATLVSLMKPGSFKFDFSLDRIFPPPAAVDISPVALSPNTPSGLSSTLTGTPSPRPTLSPIATLPVSAASIPPTLLGGDVTLPATETPLPTVTIEPTPVLAKINAPEGGGAYMRKEPAGKFMATLDNGVIVEVLGETQEISGVTWIKIAAIKNGLRMEGWVIQTVLMTATPVVNWQPTATFTPTP